MGLAEAYQENEVLFEQKEYWMKRCFDAEAILRYSCAKDSAIDDMVNAHLKEYEGEADSTDGGDWST